MNNVDKLDSIIRAGYAKNLKELILLWEKMGLDEEEVNERMTTVKIRICEITNEMVECDRENKLKIEEACDNLKKDITVLRSKLEKSEELVLVPDELPLKEQHRQLNLCLRALVKEGNEVMGVFRALINEERMLAIKLGLEVVGIDEDTIPNKADVGKIKESIRNLVKVKEERETLIFTMKEKIVTLMETLGMGANASTLSLVLDGNEPLDSLKLDDIRGIQHTMDELVKSVEERKVEVKKLISNIVNMYTRLDIQPSDQCPFATEKGCGEEELMKEENFQRLKEEELKLHEIKRENMGSFLIKAKSELFHLWEVCMVGEEQQGVFLNSLDEDNIDIALAAIEVEIRRLREYYKDHKDIFVKLSAFVDLCSLTEDLKERMKDPNRLFKNRGKTLIKEEQDRKKVNTFPKKKDELLELAENRGNLLIHGEMMTKFVENRAEKFLELFPPAASSIKQKQNVSNTRIGKVCYTPTPGNKTAPRSIKMGGKFVESPVGKFVGRSLRTPKSLQFPSREKISSPRSTIKVGKLYKSPGTKVGGIAVGPSRISHPYKKVASPLARPGKRITRFKTTEGMKKTDASSKSKNPCLMSDESVTESEFSLNVPCNSTVFINRNTAKSKITLDIDNEMVQSLFNQQQVASCNGELQEGRKQQQQSDSPGNINVIDIQPSTSKQLGQDRGGKVVRKLRRSKSCADIFLSRKKRGDEGKWLANKTESIENLPSIREYSCPERPMVKNETNLCAASRARMIRREFGN